TMVLFGDGAGAVVLQNVEAGGFLGFELGAEGAGGIHLWLPGSGSRHFDDPERFVKMNGREVFKFATRVLVSSAEKVLRECGRSVDEVDVYVPHQANVRIIDHAAKKLGIPQDRIVVNVDRYGNTSSGSIPLALARLCFEAWLEELVETEVQQPALVATSLALLAALRARGIEPDYVVGHSVGEYSALSAAGALGAAETIGLVRERGLAMAEAAKQHPGSMAAILGLEDEVVETLCRRILGVWPANYNCPGQIVVSGADPAVDQCCAEAEDEGARRTVKLKVSGAFHSPLVARAADRLRPAVERVRFAEPVAPFMSTVTAKIEPAHRLGTLLVDQLTAPVKFTQAAGELAREGVRTFVEVGPG